MSLLLKLACAIVGHKMRTYQIFTSATRRIVCNRCGGDWAMNDRERIIVPWSDEFAELYGGRGHTILPRIPQTSPDHAKSAPATTEKEKS
jgi:hypothetical protein